MSNEKKFPDVQHIDYSVKMPDTDFTYDNNYYPDDKHLPDPQIDPIIGGAKVPIQKVGIGPVDLPIKMYRRDGTTQELHAKASLYGSLDDPEAKGLNLSRFYLLMHEAVAGQLSLKGLKDILIAMKDKQKCRNAYCKLRFAYPWTQLALRTRKEVNGKLTLERQEGHIFYNCTLESEIHTKPGTPDQFKFYLTVEYVYSSTCPCSFELSHDARTRRGKAANAHSQRSICKIKIQFDPDNVVWIEDVIELARTKIPTEVQVVVKRRDEQAFAELNGSNLLFSEDAVRLMYQGLDEWFDQKKITDFSVVSSHEESLHPWNAIAVIYKGVPGGLR